MNEPVKALPLSFEESRPGEDAFIDNPSVLGCERESGDSLFCGQTRIDGDSQNNSYRPGQG